MLPIMEERNRHPTPLLLRWGTILQGCNLPDIKKADLVSRWLVISRSCVFSMTFISGLMGVLLALERGVILWIPALLSVLGLILAHGSNNLLNDWIDVKRGVDTEDYPRAQYSTHPILGGLTTAKAVLVGFFCLTAIDAALMVVLALWRGWPVLVFASAGLFISLLYTGVFKRLGLGELAALVVWGPLMTGGTAFVASGSFDMRFFIAALPYGIVVAAVLVGKHLDKMDADLKVGIRTLPALLGQRGSILLLRISALVFYLVVGLLAAFRVTGPWVLVCFISVVRLIKVWKIFAQPKPETPPENWTVWPLWYVGWAMYFNRQAGSFLVLGMLLNILVPRIIALIS